MDSTDVLAPVPRSEENGDTPIGLASTDFLCPFSGTPNVLDGDLQFEQYLARVFYLHSKLTSAPNHVRVKFERFPTYTTASFRASLRLGCSVPSVSRSTDPLARLKRTVAFSEGEVRMLLHWNIGWVCEIMSAPRSTSGSFNPDENRRKP